MKRHTPEPGDPLRFDYGSVAVLAVCRRCGVPVYRTRRRATGEMNRWQHQLGSQS